MTIRTFPAIITHWVDGDTCRVDIDLGFYSWLRDKELRLAELDCAEIRQYQGRPEEEKVVGLYTKGLVEKQFPVGSSVLVASKHQKHGKYGRIIGDFYCGNLSWTDYLMSRGLVLVETTDQADKDAAWIVIYERLVAEGEIGE